MGDECSPVGLRLAQSEAQNISFKSSIFKTGGEKMRYSDEMFTNMILDLENNILTNGEIAKSIIVL